MTHHTRDSKKHAHYHTADGDIIYMKDNYSVIEKKKLTIAEMKNKTKKGVK